MFQLAPPWLIPVDDFHSHVNNHPYRINLFQIALSFSTQSLAAAIVEKKLGCDLMAIVTQTDSEWLGCKGRVRGETIPYVPNDPAASKASKLYLDRVESRLHCNPDFYVAILYDDITSGYSSTLATSASSEI